MSEFDADKERERLREQYERDQKKREVSEKMSELLLQGATMTNAHCSDCSNPIFRYDGQEFCANCEKAVNREQSEDETGDAVEVTDTDDDARVVFGSDGADSATETAQEGESKPAQSTDATAEQPQNLPQEAADSSIEVPQDNRPETQQPTPPQTESVQQPQGSGNTDLETARNALLRALVRYSREATAADDPRRAKEHLEAAHEAAETLAVLND